MPYKRLIAGIFCSVLLSAVLAASACSSKNLTNVVPYIPPAYYSGQLAAPFDLSNIYFSPYSPASEIAKLNGNIYVFKDLPVTAITMASVNKGYVWIDVVKAYALNPSNLKQLKLGEKVDVAGVLAGPCKDFPKSLLFNSVVFLPAGSVDIPVGGDAPLQYNPTY
jgi:hypothetical protein